ncbi:MAG: RDD family protein [bacterium]
MENSSDSEKEIVCPKCSRRLLEKDTNFCPSCGTQVYRFQDLKDINTLMPPGQECSLSDKDQGRDFQAQPWAGFWIRLGSFWMDGLIILMLAMFLGSLTYSTVIGDYLFPNSEKIMLFLLILFIFYHALFLGKFKTTPGKRFFGLSIIPSKTSASFGYSETFLRTLSYFISGFPFGTGFLWIAFDTNKQGWHDKIAKTSVIKKAGVPIINRFGTLTILTFLVILMIALQFNLTMGYKSLFNYTGKPMRDRDKEIVSLLVTQKEIKSGVFKEIITRAGPHTIRLPRTARDGEIFKVNRTEEEGGVFYIRIVIVERI